MHTDQARQCAVRGSCDLMNSTDLQTSMLGHSDKALFRDKWVAPRGDLSIGPILFLHD